MKSFLGGFKKSLSRKLVAMFLLFGLLPAVGIGIFSYINGADNIEQEVFDKLNMYAASTDEELEMYFEEREGDGVVFASTQDVYGSLNLLRDAGWDTRDPDWLEQQDSLQALAETVAEEYGYDQLFLSTPDGEIVFDSEGETVGADVSDRDYVQGALEGEVTWSEMFYSDIIHENCLVLSVPVREEGHTGDIIGTANLVMDQGGVDAAVHDGLGQLGDTADAYLVDADGLLLTNTRLGDYTEGAALQESIDTHATQTLAGPIRSANWEFAQQDEYPEYRGEEVLGQMEVTRLGDEPVGLVVEIDHAEAFAGVAGLQTGIITSVILVGAVIAGAGAYMGRGIVRPIATVGDQLAELAEGGGDLTKTLQVQGEDEVGRLAESFNAFLKKIEDIVISVTDSTMKANSSLSGVVKSADQGLEHTNTLAGAAESLRSAAEHQHENTNEAASNSRQVSEGVEQVAEGAQEQATSIEDAQNLVHNMTEEIAGNLEQLQRTDELATTTRQQAGEGASAVDQVNTAVGQLSSTAEETNSTMDELKESSEEIGRITEMISEISNQTNLLALNAAIEAVRAGEAGKGFTVLAEEIRSLAERAEQATAEIATITDSMQESINSAVEGTDQSIEAIAHTAESTSSADELIASMSQAADQTKEATRTLQDSFEKLNEDMEKVTSSMQSVSSVVEENTASTEEMAAGSQEVAAAMDQISEVADDTSNNASELSGLAEEQQKLMQHVSSGAEETASVAGQIEELLAQFETSASGQKQS